MFIEKKRNFLIVLILSIAYILIMRNEIVLIKENVIEYALIFAYGVLSISKAIYFYSIKFNLFINDNNYFIFKNLMILAVSSIATLIVLYNFRFNVKKKIQQISNEEKMFSKSKSANSKKDSEHSSNEIIEPKIEEII